MAYLQLDHIDKVFTRGSTQSEVLKDINLTSTSARHDGRACSF